MIQDSRVVNFIFLAKDSLEKTTTKMETSPYVLQKPEFTCKNSNELQVTINFEVLPIEITLALGKRKILPLGLYKPPSPSENDFLLHLENALTQLNLLVQNKQ